MVRYIGNSAAAGAAAGGLLEGSTGDRLLAAGVAAGVIAVGQASADRFLPRSWEHLISQARSFVWDAKSEIIIWAGDLSWLDALHDELRGAVCDRGVKLNVLTCARSRVSEERVQRITRIGGEARLLSDADSHRGLRGILIDAETTAPRFLWVQQSVRRPAEVSDEAGRSYRTAECRTTRRGDLLDLLVLPLRRAHLALATPYPLPSVAGG